MKELCCCICGNKDENTKYTVKERLLGKDESFLYFQCGKCDLLQISPPPPNNIGEYYPSDYYAHTEPRGFIKFMDSIIKKAIIYRYTKNKHRFIGLLGSLILRDQMPPIEVTDGILNKKILDVGAGSGKLLKTLLKAGFTNVLGVDPFIADDILIQDTDNTNKILVKKGFVNDIKETFDIVMLNHSLEHMPEQLEPLIYIRELLNDKGICIVTLPTVSSYAWDKYRENWYSLEAPRHFYLHSIKSINLLVEKAGFKVDKIRYNSNHSQITRSKYYQKNICQREINKKLYMPLGLLKMCVNTIFSKYLDKIKKGDIITVYLSKL
jgi:2-polyprenyl-3-methyl-5-hydroxy-6-metoxy-1,4-benzoquinol methylase